MKKISIFGLGWLGLPLAQYLQRNDMIVSGTKSSIEGVERVRDKNINCQLFKTTQPFSFKEKKIRALFDCETLILTLQPDGYHGMEFYPKIINVLGEMADYCGVKHIIYTSSLDVYGEINGIVTENTVVAPLTEAGSSTVASENALLQLDGMSVTIVRMAHLIGGSHLPEQELLHNDVFDKVNERINLVHRNDAIIAISEIVKNGGQGHEIYNLVYPMHPTRQNFYTKIAIANDLPIPEFRSSSEDIVESTGYVDGSKIKLHLPFQYQYSIFG